MTYQAHNPVTSSPLFVVGQKVVVFNPQSQILFLKRSAQTSRPGGWDFPGGRLEDEDPIAGIKREAREEAAIELKNIRPLTLVTHEGEDPTKRVLVVGYSAELESGEVKLSWEHTEFKWLNIEEAQAVDLPEGHRQFLKVALKNYAVSGSSV